MKKIYLLLKIFSCLYFLLPQQAISQNCTTLTATCTGYESRCTATGSIKIHASGGSGSYKYKTVGPVNTNYTSTDSITGLSAGTYSVVINDITNNCSFTVNNVVVSGIYQDPRFTLNKVDVSCDNGSNGSISIADHLFGLAPFVYSIVAPSPIGVGTSNTTGTFTNLSAGNYTIRLTDSCGGIQTRQVTINNYSWSLVEYPFTKISCYEATGYIRVDDSRGNISTISGIPGFMYGIVRSPGDTLWSSSPFFTFQLLSNNSFQVIAKDSCGIIKKAPVTVSLNPQVDATVQITNRTCSSFSAALTNIRNFVNGQFCLYNSANVLISCNSTGSFDNIPYGNYCIKANDACSNTTITRCFSATAPPISISNSVLISNKTCTDFTATITGQNGLINPEYCLYNSSNILIICNNTGVFTHLPYGNYCIKTRDGCRDTTITRCFTVIRPIPIIHAITPVYINCNNFGIVVGGDTLNNPQYCLYNSHGIVIECNNTGAFDSIPIGNYCVNVYDSCYDTTIVRCFTVTLPVIQNNIVIRISNKTCSTFTAQISGASLTNPVYCLYTAADSLIGCNGTGIFNNLPYGTYCVKAHNSCPDTLLTKCFTILAPLPSVDPTVAISNLTCTGFTATIIGQTNLTHPQYCIYDSAGNLIICNTRGVFQNLPYGSYCIKVQNTCYDSTITRCFTKLPVPIQIAVIADKSCSFNYARFTITLTRATLPINIKIYKPDGSILLMGLFQNNIISIDSIPGIPVGLFYKIVAVDACGNKDSTNTGAIASFLNFNSQVVQKCPGASWANGSGNIAMSISTNMGSLTVRIIKKDGVTYPNPLVPNTASANVFTFTDLGPGTYILRSKESICNVYVYDTVTINPYHFPNLNRSSAYQCDVNGFSVSAVATYGVSPFTYEIIGSVPTIPSIITGPQTSSIFNINNGATYSLIRLRALDACGNATLGDASILPLANNGITVTQNCLFYPTTLSVDPLYGASYAWYKKPFFTSLDSVFMGATASLYIPSVLPADTGIYICYLDVNQGCIKRTYIYRLTGSCYIILPVSLQEFKGKQEANKNVLYWKTTQEQSLENYIVERQTASTAFTEIGKVAARGNSSLQAYELADLHPEPGNNYYRLKMMDRDGNYRYSNIVLLQTKKTGLIYTLFPNPVKELLSIRLTASGTQHYTISLYNLVNGLIIQKHFITTGNSILEIPRTSSISGGMYLLKIMNVDTREQATEKVIFL
jgi:hypothetical protein